MPTNPPITPATRRLVTVILLLTTFVSLMSQTMMVTALPVIEHDLHQSLNNVQWLTTGYTLVIGVVTPLSSNLYDKFTNRRVFLTTLGTFLVGTLVGCFATSFAALLAARLIQACASGILMSFQMTTMISIYPPNKRGTILGTSSLVIAAGPALGPTLAGLILQALPWRYLFILILPVMVLAWLIAYWRLPNYSQPRPIKIDLWSVIISLTGSSLALGSLTAFPVSAPTGWVMLVSGLAILALFVARQLRLQDPLLKVSIMADPGFCLMTLVGILTFMILLGTEQLVPIYAENIRHTGSFVSGMILLPGALLNAATAWLAGRLSDAYGPRWLILGGGALILLSSGPLVALTKTSSLTVLTIAYAVRMVGNALVFSPALAAAFANLTTRENSHGAALNNTLRQAMGAVAVTILVVISGLPANPLSGIRLAMWTTVGLTLLMLATFLAYLSWQRRQA